MTRAFPPAAAAVVVLVVAAATHGWAPLHLIPALLLSPATAVATSLAARRVTGGPFAATAAWVYVALPLFGLLSSLATYRHTFVHGGLPQLVGLHEPQWLALGAAGAATAAIVPRTSAGALGVIALSVALLEWRTGGLADVQGGLHETAWSPTFVAWVFVAGVAGIAVRRPTLALGIGGWAAAVILGAAHGGYGAHAEFWRALAPAAPAVALLLSGVGLLVPRRRRAQAARARPEAG